MREINVDLSSAALEVLEPALLDMETKKLSLTAESFENFVTPILSKLSLQQLRAMAAGPKKELDSQFAKTFSFAVFPFPRLPK